MARPGQAAGCPRLPHYYETTPALSRSPPRSSPDGGPGLSSAAARWPREWMRQKEAIPMRRRNLRASRPPERPLSRYSWTLSRGEGRRVLQDWRRRKLKGWHELSGPPKRRFSLICNSLAEYLSLSHPRTLDPRILASRRDAEDSVSRAYFWDHGSAAPPPISRSF